MVINIGLHCLRLVVAESVNQTWCRYGDDVAFEGSLRFIICIINCEPADQQPGSWVFSAMCMRGWEGVRASMAKICLLLIEARMPETLIQSFSVMMFGLALTCIWLTIHETHVNLPNKFQVVHEWTIGIHCLRQAVTEGANHTWYGCVTDVACVGSLYYITGVFNLESADRQLGSSVGGAMCPQEWDPG